MLQGNREYGTHRGGRRTCTALPQPQPQPQPQPGPGRAGDGAGVGAGAGTGLGLAWTGLTWPGLAWPGLAWPAWTGLAAGAVLGLGLNWDKPSPAQPSPAQPSPAQAQFCTAQRSAAQPSQSLARSPRLPVTFRRARGAAFQDRGKRARRGAQAGPGRRVSKDGRHAMGSVQWRSSRREARFPIKCISSSSASSLRTPAGREGRPGSLLTSRQPGVDVASHFCPSATAGGAGVSGVRCVRSPHTRAP
eukprot:gene13039-biopygen18535